MSLKKSLKHANQFALFLMDFEGVVFHNICKYSTVQSRWFLCQWPITLWNSLKIGDRFARLVEWKSVTDTRKTREV